MPIFQQIFNASQRPQTFNTNSSNWNGRNYAVAEFTVLQNNGCVFLPAAGYRDGRDGFEITLSVGYGYYWSASPGSDSYAYDLYFLSNNVYPDNNDARYRAQSVRLVTESKY